MVVGVVSGEVRRPVILCLVKRLLGVDEKHKEEVCKLKQFFAMHDGLGYQ